MSEKQKSIQVTKPKHPGGRPTKYIQEFHCQSALDLARDGKTQSEMAKEWGVCLDTITEWKKQHKEFSSTIKKAKQLMEAWWIEKGRSMIDSSSKNTNPTIFIWLTKNILGWKDKVELSPEDNEREGLEFVNE